LIKQNNKQIIIKMNKLLFSLVVCALVLFTGCSDDDESPSIKITFTEITDSSVKITWDKVEGATGYSLEHKVAGESSDDNWAISVVGTSYVLDGLNAETEYEISMDAFGGTTVENMKLLASGSNKVTTTAATDKE